MRTLRDGCSRNSELWGVVLAVYGRVSMESNDEGWSHGIYTSFHGRPSELVLLDLEGLSISTTFPDHEH